jgi:hypothetical protein
MNMREYPTLHIQVQEQRFHCCFNNEHSMYPKMSVKRAVVCS